MKSILILEDDNNLNDTICDFLEDNGYDVTSTYDGYEAQEKLYENRYDLLLLDVNTPNINGFDLLKEVRKNGISSPAIFITSLSGIDDLQEGFDSGCDDYIRKPFVLKELLIRVKTLLKREFFHQSKKLIEIDKNISYDIDNCELLIDDNIISLGQKEAKLLNLFIKNQDRVLSHDTIYDYLWNFDETYSDNALRTYIKNIRKLIGKDKIVSIKKQGYKFIF